jgi:uncharacterized protein YecE (DUF72 family)
MAGPDRQDPGGRELKAVQAPRIRVGVGGWTYEPWRDNFYPAGWPHARELEYASRHLSAIEINGTYYRTPTPSSVAQWRDSTPDDFVFSVKASRYATNRRELADAGEAVARFIGSGITELGPKLGPIVWQFAPTKRFDAADFNAFLELLPRQADSLALRHVMDVRHDSFRTPDYLALARRHGVATVLTASDDYPALFDERSPMLYARIMRTEAGLPEGFPSQTLDQLAVCARVLRAGGLPSGMPLLQPVDDTPVPPRDVFVFFISGAKERAPAAAMALMRRLD